jgi:hypothetical protein
VSNPIRFGQSPLVPSQRWASSWSAGFPDHFHRVIELYRQRVRQYWDSEARIAPDAFLLLGPVEIVAVASLARTWIFGRPAKEDSIRVIEEWEHPLLADRELQRAPSDQAAAKAQSVALDGPGWQLINDELVAGYRIASDQASFMLPREEAHSLADDHAHAVRLAEAFNQLWGRAIDRSALAAAHDELLRLEQEQDAAARGRAFEQVFLHILVAHGCQVERGNVGDAEQIDLFIFKPIHALVECKWRANRVEPGDISILIGKLLRRPAVVGGLFVSMSGFTTGAQREAMGARDRTVVLFTREDVLQLSQGSIHFKELWDARVDDLIRRYPK